MNKNMIFLNLEINTCMLFNKRLNIKALKLKFTRRRNILFVIGSQLDNQILLRLICKTMVASLSLRANIS